MHILHNCAECYVKLGKHKVYLDEPLEDVKAKIDSGETFITLYKSTLTGRDAIVVKASDISFLKDCNW